MPNGPLLHKSLTALPELLADCGPFLFVRDPIAWEASGAAAALGVTSGMGGAIARNVNMHGRVRGGTPNDTVMGKAAVAAARVNDKIITRRYEGNWWTLRCEEGRRQGA